MKRDIRIFLKDILESIDKIEEYTHSVSKKEFFEKGSIQDAVIRRLEIIGEAAKNIPDDLRAKYKDIPWVQIAGMRDVLIHGYFRVNIARVWAVIEKDLPLLKSKISQVSKELGIL